MKRGATDRTYPHCIRQLHCAHDAEHTARMLCPADYPALQGWLPPTPGSNSRRLCVLNRDVPTAQSFLLFQSVAGDWGTPVISPSTKGVGCRKTAGTGG